MALTWDFTACKDPDALKTDEEWPVTEMLIWCTLFTGIGGLTERTASEFYARVHWMEKTQGAFLRGTDPETGDLVAAPLTIEDVIKRIGLKTNATFEVETRASWLKRNTRADPVDALRDFNAALAKERVA